MRTLDEIPATELAAELSARRFRLTHGCCPYCNVPLVHPDGKLYDFHNAPMAMRSVRRDD